MKTLKSLFAVALAALSLTASGSKEVPDALLPDTSRIEELSSLHGVVAESQFSESIVVTTVKSGEWKKMTFSPLPAGVTAKFDAKTQTLTLSSKKVTAKQGWYYPVLTITGAADGSVLSRAVAIYVGSKKFTAETYAAMLETAIRQRISISDESSNRATWWSLSVYGEAKGVEQVLSGAKAVDCLLRPLRPKESISVKGLPTGVKLNAKWSTYVDDDTGEAMTYPRITGVPTKAGVYPVTVTEKVLQKDGKTKTLTSAFTMVVGMTSSRYIRIEAAEGGTVSAKSGIYAEGTVITAKATPKKGYVFAGWFAPALGIGEKNADEWGNPYCSYYDSLVNGKETDYRLATAKWCVTGEGIGSNINEGGMIAKDGWLIAGFLPVEVENNMLAARQAAYDADPEDENGRNFLGLRDNTSTFDQDMWGFIKETDFIYDLRDPDAYLDLSFISDGLSYSPITLKGVPKGFVQNLTDKQLVGFYSPINNEVNRKRQPAPGVYVVTATATSQSKFTMTRQIVIRVIDDDFTFFTDNVPRFTDFQSVKSGQYMPVAGSAALGHIAEKVDPVYPDFTAMAGSDWTFAVSGQPNGVALAKNGVWNGAPTKAGTFVVKVTASRKSGKTTEKHVFSFVHEVTPFNQDLCGTCVCPFTFASKKRIEGVATITLAKSGKFTCKLEHMDGRTQTLNPGKDAFVHDCTEDYELLGSGKIFGETMVYGLGVGVSPYTYLCSFIAESEQDYIFAEGVAVLSHDPRLKSSFPKFAAQTLDFATVDKGSPMSGLTMSIKKNAKDDITFVYKNDQGKTVQSGSAKMMLGDSVAFIGTWKGRPCRCFITVPVVKAKAAMGFEGMVLSVALVVDNETGLVVRKAVSEGLNVDIDGLLDAE